MGGLKLFFLGPFEATLEDAPLAGLRSTKARGLLANLASKPGVPHPRETLATLLWGEAPDAAARLSLRVALTHLRQALAPIEDAPGAPRLLTTTRYHVEFTLDPAFCWIDAAEFDGLLAACGAHADAHVSISRCPACIERLKQAVTLYRGDFLADLEFHDSPAFDLWRTIEQERFHRQAMAALDHLTQYHLRLEDFAAAQETARRQLALEPWREEAHRQVMRSLALSGQRAAALAQYELARRTLAAEMGVVPDDETGALYEQILAGAPLRPEQAGSRQATPEPAAALTPFVGREEELKHFGELIGDPACRLLTLVGPGGIGKTRLAVQAATQYAALCPDGVCYASLRFDDDSEQLTMFLADVLRFAPGRDTPSSFAQLVGYLQRKAMLLVLDDCAAKTPTTAWIVDLLRNAPDLKIVAIARQRLNVRGEWLLHVEGLACASPAVKNERLLEPPEYSESILAQLMAAEDASVRQEPTSTAELCAAARLFVACARRVVPDFQLTPAELPHVLAICQLVQGMPLAIELAARWLTILSCSEIAAEIQTNLDFLATTQEDVPTRQQSLRAVFNQAWALLSPAERDVFVRLSVFRGVFDRAAAAAVAGASLSILASLVDKGLLRSEVPNPTHAEVRFSVHAVLRHYAVQKLRELPEEPDRVLGLHSQYYLGFLAQKQAALEGPQQQAALGEIAAQLENVRMAWRLGVARKNTAALSSAWHSAYLFCTMRSWFHLGERAFKELVKVYADDDHVGSDEQTALVGVALACQGWFAFQLGAHAEADALLPRGVAILRSLQASEALAFALSCRAATVLHLGRYDEAEQCGYESLSLFHAAGNRCGQARVLGTLGQITFRRHQLEEAQRVCLAGLDVARSIGNRWSMAVPLAILGRIALTQCEFDRAHQMFTEVLTIRRERGDRRGVALTYMHLGALEQARGQPRTALHRYGEALGVYWRLGYQDGVLEALLAIASSLVEAGQGEDALLLLAVVRHQDIPSAFDWEHAETLYASASSQLSAAGLAAAEANAHAASLDSLVERYRVLHPW